MWKFSFTRNVALFLSLSTGVGVQVQAASAAQGAGSSGGGSAVVCRDRDGLTISSATLSDLAAYEFKHQVSIPRVQATGNPEQDDAMMLQELDRVLGGLGARGESVIRDSIEWEIALARKAWVFTPLPATAPSDLGERNPIPVPRGCALERVADYLDRSKNLSVDPDLFHAMSITDRAALVMHEAVYRFQRRLIQKGLSEDVREAVGALFASGGAEVPLDQFFTFDLRKVASEAAIRTWGLQLLYGKPAGESMMDIVVETKNPAAAEVELSCYSRAGAGQGRLEGGYLYAESPAYLYEGPLQVFTARLLPQKDGTRKAVLQMSVNQDCRGMRIQLRKAGVSGKWDDLKSFFSVVGPMLSKDVRLSITFDSQPAIVKPYGNVWFSQLYFLSK